MPYRKANGAFRGADQLASVKGIGLATIEKNRDRIVVRRRRRGGAPELPLRQNRRLRTQLSPIPNGVRAAQGGAAGDRP